jgi:hypothetical protein
MGYLVTAAITATIRLDAFAILPSQTFGMAGSTFTARTWARTKWTGSGRDENGDPHVPCLHRRHGGVHESLRQALIRLLPPRTRSSICA